jgi:hypothetical protein
VSGVTAEFGVTRGVFAVMRPEVVSGARVAMPLDPKNKEPKTSEEPSEETEEEEPSFLKKYWWAILLIYVLAQVVASSVEDGNKPETKSN